jgi:hypothetical protein
MALLLTAAVLARTDTRPLQKLRRVKQGELTLNLTVAGSGREEKTFDFPVVLRKYPVTVSSFFA